jgi:hypothetical protein
MQTLDPTPGKHEADYDVDFFAWTQRTAALLRSGRFDELDVESLRPEVARQVTRRWAVAVENAAAKTGLAADVFPASCPWSGEQILDDAFYPRGLLGDVTGPRNKSG